MENKDLLALIAQAEDLGFYVPADVLLEISRQDTKDLIAALKLRLNIKPGDLPLFNLREPGAVPAPKQTGLILGSQGWQDLPATQIIQRHGGGGTRTNPSAADILALLLTVDGTGSGLDADLLDGQHGAYYLPAASYTAADVLAKLLTVDGTGSLLDADLLDGQHAAAFQTALSFPLAANLGGTGVANLVGSTLTLGAATSVTGGGTIALGGYTLTVPDTGTAALVNYLNSGYFSISREGSGAYYYSKTYRSSEYGGGFIFLHARNTADSPQYLIAGDRIASIFLKGYDGTVANEGNSASIEAFASANHSSISTPAYLTFSTSNTTAVSVRLRITSTGLITVGAEDLTGMFNVIGSTDINQILIKANATQTASDFVMQDSTAKINNKLCTTYATTLKETVFNEQGSAYLDLRAESDTEANMLFLDASADLLYLGGSPTGAIVAKGGLVTTKGRRRAWRIATTTDTITVSDEVIICNSTTAFAINLPAATGTGQFYAVPNVNTGVITLTPNGTDTINGELNQTIDQWSCIQVVDYGIGLWTII